MTPGPEADALHLGRVLERIALIEAALEGVSFDSFRRDRTLIGATALRLASIGETTRRLSGDLKTRHEQIPWEPIYRLRNLVAHDYDAIDPEIIWKTATMRLAELRDVCRAELERLGG